MTPFVAAVRGLLWLVLVAGVALSVFWLVTLTPAFDPVLRILVVVVVGAAAVGLAALPRRRKGRPR